MGMNCEHDIYLGKYCEKCDKQSKEEQLKSDKKFNNSFNKCRSLGLSVHKYGSLTFGPVINADEVEELLKKLGV